MRTGHFYPMSKLPISFDYFSFCSRNHAGIRDPFQGSVPRAVEKKFLLIGGPMGIVRGTHLAGNSAPKCGLCGESKLSITVGLDLRRDVDSPWKDLRRRSTSSLN